MIDAGRRAILMVLAGAALSGCVVSRDPPTASRTLEVVEQRKREIAQLRDRGLISYEEAVRRQYAIQRHAYALTDGELSFWRASIDLARKVDAGAMTPAAYHQAVEEAYLLYARPKPAG